MPGEFILKYETDGCLNPAIDLSRESPRNCDFCDNSSLELWNDHRSSSMSSNTPAIHPHGKQAETPKLYFGKSTNRRCVDYSRFLPGDHYAYRYELEMNLGGGCFGTVVKAFDHRDNKFVALKLVNQQTHDGKGYWARKEASVMEFLKQMKGVSDGANVRSIGIVFLMEQVDFHGFAGLSMDLLGSNLGDAISNNAHAGFPSSKVRMIVPSLLRGLEFMHAHGYVHMDLKMANLVLNNDDDWSQGAKLVDFNLTCKPDEIEGRRRVQIAAWTGKRFPALKSEAIRKFADLSWGLYPLPHAPPEALLCSRGMSEKMDIWSLGTILAELHHGKPAFSDSSVKSCLASIVAALGELSNALIKNTELSMLMYHGIGPKQLLLRAFAGAAKRQVRATKAALFAKTEPLLADFLMNMISLDAADRWSASELLTHKWLR